MLTLGAAGAGGSMGLMIFVVIMFVGMYFLSIRPQKKQQQKRQEMLKQMSEGDRVVTLGGIKGKIAKINTEAKEVVVDCDGIYLTFDLNFIRRVDSKSTDKGTEDSAMKTAVETKTDETVAKADVKDAKEDVKEDAPKTDVPEAADTEDSAKTETTDEAPKDETK